MLRSEPFGLLRSLCLIGFCLIGGRLVASPLGAHVDTVLLIQILISVALFPVLSRLVSRLDGRRRAR